MVNISLILSGQVAYDTIFTVTHESTEHDLYVLVKPALDSIALKICEERGHVWVEHESTWFTYCPPYLIDEDDRSYWVVQYCDKIKQICERCGKVEIKFQPNDTIIIWERPIEFFIKTDAKDLDEATRKKYGF